MDSREKEIRERLEKAIRPSRLEWREQLHSDIDYLLAQLDAVRSQVATAKAEAFEEASAYVGKRAEISRDHYVRVFQDKATSLRSQAGEVKL